MTEQTPPAGASAPGNTAKQPAPATATTAEVARPAGATIETPRRRRLARVRSDRYNRGR